MDPAPGVSISVAEATRFLGVPEEEVRASNARLQRELKDPAEERLMLMERIEHIARIEKELEESSSELERLRSRRLLDRLLNR